MNEVQVQNPSKLKKLNVVILPIERGGDQLFIDALPLFKNKSYEVLIFCAFSEHVKEMELNKELAHVIIIRTRDDGERTSSNVYHNPEKFDDTTKTTALTYLNGVERQSRNYKNTLLELINANTSISLAGRIYKDRDGQIQVKPMQEDQRSSTSSHRKRIKRRSRSQRFNH